MVFRLLAAYPDQTFGGQAFTDCVQLPRRWVVERMFAWFGHYRRLSKDYEYSPTTSEMMLYVAMGNLMLRSWPKSFQTRS